LTNALGLALQRLGARVTIDIGGENLVRAVGTPRVIEIPPRHPHRGPPVVEVCAQGLPNLLHEFVHLVLAARLDDDHGIDYHAIPYDLDTPLGRRVLFEELSAIVLSCAYCQRDESPSTLAFVDDWFCEQVEIQPVFYGMDGDADRFWERVQSVVTTHAVALHRVLDLAYARAQTVLAWAGAPPQLARPPCRLSFETLLSRHRHGATWRSVPG
jgi:hypothetical protein